MHLEDKFDKNVQSSSESSINVFQSKRRFKCLLIDKSFKWPKLKKIEANGLQRKEGGESLTFRSKRISLRGAHCPTSVLDWMYVYASSLRQCTGSSAAFPTSFFTTNGLPKFGSSRTNAATSAFFSSWKAKSVSLVHLNFFFDDGNAWRGAGIGAKRLTNCL